MLHLDNIWDWTSSPRSRFCSGRFCCKLRNNQPRKTYTLSTKIERGTSSHVSTAVAPADSADEDVLAIALLVGQGAATITLNYFILLTEIILYRQIYQFMYLESIVDNLA